MAESKSTQRPGAVKNQSVVMLSYTDLYALSPTTAGTPAYNTFRTNGAYDPDFTGAGHQPLGFDEMAAFYDEYCVESVSVTAEFGNRSTVYQGVGAILQHVDSTPPSTGTTWLENPTCGYKFCRVASAGGAAIVRMNWQAHKFFGVPKSKLSEVDDAWSLTSNNPDGVHFFSVGFMPFETQTITADVTVKIKMKVRFRKPKALLQS
jgi:hypothetical protein